MTHSSKYVTFLQKCHIPSKMSHLSKNGIFIQKWHIHPKMAYSSVNGIKSLKTSTLMFNLWLEKSRLPIAYFVCKIKFSAYIWPKFVNVTKKIFTDLKFDIIYEHSLAKLLKGKRNQCISVHLFLRQASLWSCPFNQETDSTVQLAAN